MNKNFAVVPYLAVAALAVGCALMAPAPAENWAVLDDLPPPAAGPAALMSADLRSNEMRPAPQPMQVAQWAPELRPVQGFELHRYLGTWYEIARIPEGHDADCAASVSTQYLAAADDSVSVLTRCSTAASQVRQTVGVVTQPEAGVGRLRVSYLPRGLGWLPVARADYWVVDIDPQYRYALVGTPDRSVLRVLARESGVPQKEFERLLTRARELGFQTAQLSLTNQEHGVTELPLLVVQR